MELPFISRLHGEEMFLQKSIEHPLSCLHGDFLQKMALVAFWKRSSYPITIKISSKKMEKGLANNTYVAIFNDNFERNNLLGPRQPFLQNSKLG
jgi:hypothetical protein